MDFVECDALLGGKKLIPREKLTFRPSAYAIIVNDGQILLLTNRQSGKYVLPGGGIELGERIEHALQREVKEETGLTIAVGRFAHFEDTLYYLDPIDVAWHSFLFFYFCSPLSSDLLPDDKVADEGDEKPRWVPISRLSEDQFQSQGSVLMQLLGM